MLRVDSPRSETSVLHELTRTKTAEDAESKIAVRFVNQNDHKKICFDWPELCLQNNN